MRLGLRQSDTVTYTHTHKHQPLVRIAKVKRKLIEKRVSFVWIAQKGKVLLKIAIVFARQRSTNIFWCVFIPAPMI